MRIILKAMPECEILDRVYEALKALPILTPTGNPGWAVVNWKCAVQS